VVVGNRQDSMGAKVDWQSGNWGIGQPGTPDGRNARLPDCRAWRSWRLGG